MGVEKMTTQKKLTVITKNKPFFFLKCSLDCCKSLINFQSPEKVGLATFASVLIYFMREWIFRDSIHLFQEYSPNGPPKLIF